ncbi:MAG: PorT family protein [Candidatus Latescibacterota bacterium]|nr:MAG: PorT family protein [Candidatus Latescibacterota bacterium]
MTSATRRSDPARRERHPAGAAVRIAAVLLVAALLRSAAAAGAEKSSLDPRPGGRALAELSFGFKAGLSLSQHAGTEERDSEYSVASGWRTGFAACAFIYFPVTARFALQQEIAYVQKGSRQDIGVDILDIPTVLDVAYDMDYIEIPVLLRFALAQWSRGSIYSLAGTALSLKVRDRYTLAGAIDDGEQSVPLRADDDMSEVDMFDFSFVYGLGLELSIRGRNLFAEHRFTMGWNTLSMPTYAYVPFGDERILIDNEPVPLKNQSHLVLVGIRF